MSLSQLVICIIGRIKSLFFSEPSGSDLSAGVSLFLPTWDDCQQLLQTLVTSEEREKVKAEGGRTAFLRNSHCLKGDKQLDWETGGLVEEIKSKRKNLWGKATGPGLRDRGRVLAVILLATDHYAGVRVSSVAYQQMPYQLTSRSQVFCKCN
uniref:Core shell protein Gag P30 domain-containing protein n=1 Tax=Myotis myotis TaxID=51298 RepID=A0A7J7Z4M6_MYOMY|nr:hypothetical protein mMyoMyo1_010519 [Myotis myotis]